MTDTARTFTVTLDTSGPCPFARVDPPNDLLAEFINDEIAMPVMRADLLVRADDALSGQTSCYGSNVFATDFELDGVVLEHNYLEGEPSVKIGLRNFIDIVTAYSEAQTRTVPGRPNSDQ